MAENSPKWVRKQSILRHKLFNGGICWLAPNGVEVEQKQTPAEQSNTIQHHPQKSGALSIKAETLKIRKSFENVELNFELFIAYGSLALLNNSPT